MDSSPDTRQGAEIVATVKQEAIYDGKDVTSVDED